MKREAFRRVDPAGEVAKLAYLYLRGKLEERGRGGLRSEVAAAMAWAGNRLREMGYGIERVDNGGHSVRYHVIDRQFYEAVVLRYEVRGSEVLDRSGRSEDGARL
jgi:hypothetical protein